METLVIQIKDKKKSQFVKELLSSFDFLEVKKEAKQKPLTKREKELKEALADVQLSLSGKKKLKTLDELLNEL